jgi:hypothetical protein
MNKLDEIIESKYPVFAAGDGMYSTNVVKQIALEFAKHILEEAVENAKTIQDKEFYCLSSVNKQSITDTLNKYL